MADRYGRDGNITIHSLRDSNEIIQQRRHEVYCDNLKKDTETSQMK